jgi:hypothetical protein
VGLYDHSDLDGNAIVAFGNGKEGATNTEIIDEFTRVYEEYGLSDFFGVFPVSIDDHQLYRMVSPDTGREVIEFYLWHSGTNYIAVGAGYEDKYGDQEHFATLFLAAEYLKKFPSDLEHEYIATCYDRNRVQYYRGDEDTNREYIPGTVEGNHILERNGEVIDFQHISKFDDYCDSDQELYDQACSGSLKVENTYGCDCVNGYCIHPLVVQEIEGAKLVSIGQDNDIYLPNNDPVDGYWANYRQDVHFSENGDVQTLIQKHEKEITSSEFQEFMENEFDDFSIETNQGNSFYVVDIRNDIILLWYSGDVAIAIVTQEIGSDDTFEAVIESYVDRYPSDVEGGDNELKDICENVVPVEERDRCYIEGVLNGDYKQCQKIENPNLKENCQAILVDNCGRINDPKERDSCFMELIVNGDFSECQVIENPYMKENCQDILAKNCGEIYDPKERDSCFMELIVNGDFSECQVIENPYLKESCESIVT